MSAEGTPGSGFGRRQLSLAERLARTIAAGGPMTLAAVLHAPVVLGFGLWLGPRRYRLSFEPFAETIELPRQGRETALRGWLERYAARLGEVCRAHPYNWFNFYEFWGEGS